MPSVQQERITVISSTCSAVCGYQSDTHMPLCPYCLKVRFEGIRPFFDVPGIAVNFGRIDSGIGWPAMACSLGFGSNRSTWLGPPSMKSQMMDLAVAGWSGFLGAMGSDCGSRLKAILLQHLGQRDAGQSAANARKEIPARGCSTIMRILKITVHDRIPFLVHIDELVRI